MQSCARGSLASTHKRRRCTRWTTRTMRLAATGRSGASSTRSWTRWTGRTARTRPTARRATTRCSARRTQTRSATRARSCAASTGRPTSPAATVPRVPQAGAAGRLGPGRQRRHGRRRIPQRHVWRRPVLWLSARRRRLCAHAAQQPSVAEQCRRHQGLRWQDGVGPRERRLRPRRGLQLQQQRGACTNQCLANPPVTHC